MERVLVIGCGGSGKSTLSRKLGEKTGLPVIHLDKLFWHSGWVESTREEIDEKIVREMEKDCWIIDGNYMRTLPLRLQKCDTVIYLDFSTLRCICGVLRRVLTSYGKVRPDMGEGCPERFDWEFLKWVWRFNRENRPRLYSALEAAPAKSIIILKNRRQVNRYLESL